VQKAAPAERKALMAHLADLSVADRLEHIVTDMSHIPRTIRIRMRSRTSMRSEHRLHSARTTPRKTDKYPSWRMSRALSVESRDRVPRLTMHLVFNILGCVVFGGRCERGNELRPLRRDMERLVY
jgi:hypothetical protein